ncbi:MAG: hypothetical protein JNK85_07380 [Verrucomicrobiales bacterium]|nr:hypothetical protein [Verrucomicrobiales bacterium]
MKTGIYLAVICAMAGVEGFAANATGPRRTQQIHLRAGWNAVFLEVQPDRAKPDEAFAGQPVTSVAAFFSGRAEAQFLRSPGDAPWREEGWAVWHAPDRPDAVLSNLHRLQAHRPLLVLASSDFTWSVTGEARATVLQWHPDTCTFTGLPVDAAAPPTFAEFFSGSPAHQRLRCYRLEAGAWKLVRNPASDRIRSGEAYWIETDGGSTYQGPLRVKLPASGALDFDTAVASRSLRLNNESPQSSAQLRMERVSGELPLRRTTRDLSKLETKATDLPSSLSLGALPPGASTTVRLEPARDRMTTARSEALLRITDGRGTEQWIPVRAQRSEANR